MTDKKESLSERIARMRKGGLTSAAEVAKTVREAQQVSASPEDVKTFFEAVAKGRSIIAFDLSQKMPERKAREFTFNLSWDDCLSKIRFLANGGSAIAQEVVVVYETFASNPLLYAQLQQVLETFERPCHTIRTKEEIISFLEELSKKGLAEKTREHPKRKAIHWDDAWYAPKRGIALARLGWVFVVMATTRAQRRETADKELLKRLKPLFEIATLSHEPEESGLTRLLNGEPGTVVMWSTHCWWGGKDQGLFAIALTHTPRGYYLNGVDADLPLLKKIKKGYQLPPILPNGEFGEIPRLEKEEYQALRQIERLIQFRLRAENQAAAHLALEAVEPAAE